MTDTNLEVNTTPTDAPASAAPTTAPVSTALGTDTRGPSRGGAGGRGRTGGAGGRGGAGGAGGRGGPGGRSPQRARPPRVKSEFDQKMINMRRVARTVAGGRRFSFSVAIIIGNRKGKVGVGLGKAGDTTLAIDKAVRDAKKNMITINLTKNSSIAHDVYAKFCASRVMLMPAPGRSLIAGSSVRSVLELAGVTDVVGKLHSGTKNGLNNAQATIDALRSLKA